VFTDHNLPDSAEDQISEEEHEKSFAMESAVSIAILVILWLVHVSKNLVGLPSMDE
jgi:hypothetical protein